MKILIHSFTFEPENADITNDFRQNRTECAIFFRESHKTKSIRKIYG